MGRQNFENFGGNTKISKTRKRNRKVKRKPYPSLWIGGSGEQVTLKLVAKYANACNIGGDPDTIRRKLDVLRGHCQTVGRNYDDIIKSTSLNVFLLKPGEDARIATAPVTRALGAGFEELDDQAAVG